jgi:hypothetical protein
MRLRYKLLIPVLALVLLTGCIGNPKPVTGSANQFDSDSYLTLLTTDTVIEATKADLNNGAFPASTVTGVKTALNALITAYDAAQPVYIAYHTAALAGQATQAQQAQVTAALSSVQTATTALVVAKGVGQ